MKKFLLFSLMLVALTTTIIGFTSCSKDDDEGAKPNNTENPNGIIGRKWFWGDKKSSCYVEFKKDGTFRYQDAANYTTNNMEGSYRIIETKIVKKDEKPHIIFYGETATLFVMEITSNGKQNLEWEVYYMPFLDNSIEYLHIYGHAADGVKRHFVPFVINTNKE